MVLFRITENEPSKMHNVRPYVYSRPWVHLDKDTKINSITLFQEIKDPGN